jgi:peptidoglycan/LPS O-acetylase OafA/YrhL
MQRTSSIQARNTSIDVMRLFAILFVVIDHVDWTQIDTSDPVNQIVHIALGNLPVPFFFCVSGYYLFNSDKNKVQQTCLRHLQKLSKIFAIASISYIIIEMIRLTVYHMQPLDIIKNFFSFDNFYSVFVTQNVDFTPTSNVLWFLLCEIGMYAVVLVLNKIKFRDIFIIIFLFWGILVYLTPIIGIHLPSNRLLTSSIFFIAGYLIKKYNDKLNSIKTAVIISVFSVSLILHVIPYSLVGKELLIAVVITSGFLLLLRFPSIFSNTPLPKWGQLYTINIYLVHTICQIPVNLISRNPYFVWIASFLLSFLVAVIYQKLKRFAMNRS